MDTCSRPVRKEQIAHNITSLDSCAGNFSETDMLCQDRTDDKLLWCSEGIGTQDWAKHIIT